MYDDIYNFAYRHGTGGQDKNFDVQNFVMLLKQYKDDPEFFYITKIDPLTNEFEAVIWAFSEQKLVNYSRFGMLLSLTTLIRQTDLRCHLIYLQALITMGKALVLLVH